MRRGRRKRKLLIADDEGNIRRGTAKYIALHTDRFEKICEAANGQEAIDCILQHLPDLVLLDVQMPGKNGIDVMREAEEAGAAPVFAILSGYDEFAYAQQALRYGAKEYLLKPVRAADILACLYLQQRTLKTYEIAYRMDFQDEKYFARVFRKVMGVSPKQYAEGKTGEPSGGAPAESS